MHAWRDVVDTKNHKALIYHSGGHDETISSVHMACPGSPGPLTHSKKKKKLRIASGRRVGSASIQHGVNFSQRLFNQLLPAGGCCRGSFCLEIYTPSPYTKECKSILSFD